MITLCSSGEGTTSDLSFCLKCCVGEAPRCCSWSSSCCRWCLIFALQCGLVRHLWGFSLMNIQFSVNAFFKVSSIGIYLKSNLILSVAFPFSNVLKCWCGTIATLFSQAAQRDSHDLCLFFFFCHGCTFLVATTIACCPCRSVRVTYTLAVGSVVQIATRWLPKLLWCPATHWGFLPKADVLSCQRFVCSMIPVLRAWHCVLPLLSVVATGIPQQAGGWHLRMRPRVVLLLLLLEWFCTWWDVPSGFKQPVRNVSSSVVEIWRPCNYVNSFWALPHSKCQHRSRPHTLGTLGRARNVLRLGVLRTSTIVDNDSANFLKTDSLCNVCMRNNAFYFQPFASVGALLVPWQVGYANGSPFGNRSMTHPRRPMWRNGFSKFMLPSERSNSESQGDVVPETPKVSMLVSSSPWAVILFSVIWCQQILFFSITYAEAQHLQLEPWAPTWKRRCYRKTNCGEVEYHHSARGFWVCLKHKILHERFHATHFAGLRDLLPWHQRQIDLPLWHEARCARSNCWRRTGIGFTRRSLKCLFSSCCSQWSESLYCVIPAYQQHLCHLKVLPR